MNDRRYDKYWLLAQWILCDGTYETFTGYTWLRDELLSTADKFYNAADLFYDKGDKDYDIIFEAIKDHIFGDKEKGDVF